MILSARSPWTGRYPAFPVKPPACVYWCWTPAGSLRAAWGQAAYNQQSCRPGAPNGGTN